MNRRQILDSIHKAAQVAARCLRPRTRAGLCAWHAERTRLAPRRLPVACSAGCSHCCYQPVIMATPLEVALAYEATEDRALGQAPLRPGWPPPCPLLSATGLCQVYEVRPAVCRGEHSLDRDACAKGLGHGHPGYQAHVTHEQTLLVAELCACHVLGLDAEPVDLARGLAALGAWAAAHPGRRAVDAWLAGERLFAEARLPAEARLAEHTLRVLNEGRYPTITEKEKSADGQL